VASSIKEVARHAGVSIGTVSNVLNRPDQVAPETRQRVLAAIDLLGYVRNDSARQLRAGSSRTIAIVVLDVTNPFFTDIVRGAEAVAEASGAVLVVCNSGEDQGRERRHLEILEEQRVRGVLITPVDDAPDSRLAQLAMRGTPVVLVDREAGLPERCSVAVDDVLGGRLAGQHLLDRGHRRIAYVGGPASIRQVADRHAGIAAALRDQGSLHVVATPSLSVAAGRQAARELAELPAGERPTAAFCANDLLALGVLQEMTLRGLRVPDDLAIVGYDDIEYAAAAAVPLSSVRQPREQLGRTATELLLEEVRERGAHRHRHVVFQPDLVIRDSSAGPAGAPR
jgi:DNA-binding LacI/PurR family transcriptional regulator